MIVHDHEDDVYIIRCDNCGQGDAVSGDTDASRREYARDYGWDSTSEEDYCSECIEEDRARDLKRLKGLYRDLR